MTKQELIDFLQPFTDEIEIVLHGEGKCREVDHLGYAMRTNGDGVVLLHIGAQILLPKILA